MCAMCVMWSTDAEGHSESRKGGLPGTPWYMSACRHQVLPHCPLLPLPGQYAGECWQSAFVSRSFSQAYLHTSDLLLLVHLHTHIITHTNLQCLTSSSHTPLPHTLLSYTARPGRRVHQQPERQRHRWHHPAETPAARQTEETQIQGTKLAAFISSHGLHASLSSVNDPTSGSVTKKTLHVHTKIRIQNSFQLKTV